MGYPMSYDRLLHRNSLLGDYQPRNDNLSCIRGDLRRLEHDQQDDRHVAAYAKLAGVSKPKARRLLALFFAPAIGSEVGQEVHAAMAREWNREHHVTPRGT